MRVRMFKPQFAPLVEAGAKRQTIRPVPKRPQDMPQPGDLESWREWTGLPYRSKQRELAQVRIEFVIPVVIGDTIVRPDLQCNLKPALVARSDGFKNWSEMKAWIKATHGLPFTGILIKAEDA